MDPLKSQATHRSSRTAPVGSASTLGEQATKGNEESRGIFATTSRFTQAYLLVAIAWFLLNTWKGLFVFFSGDDVMNVYKAWERPLSRLVLANLWPVTTEYRPVGSVFYRVLYSLFGFSPFPFRVACFVLLTINIVLAYRLAHRLSGSWEIGVLVAILSAYHKNLIEIYTNGGTVYDILCYYFYYAALVAYVTVKGLARRNTPAKMLFVALSSFALSSKEMAITLPVALWILEAVYWPPPRWDDIVAVCRWPLSRGVSIWVVTAIAVIAGVTKLGAASSFGDNSAYSVVLSFNQFWSTSAAWMAQLFWLKEDEHTSVRIVTIIVCLAVGALLDRRKHLVVCIGLIILVPLPVMFLPKRGFYVMYMATFPWSLLVATLLVNVRDKLLRSVTINHFPRTLPVFLFVLLTLFALNLRKTALEPIRMTQVANQSLSNALSSECPGLSRPTHANILLVGDGFQEWVWDPLFVARLLYHNQELDVYRTNTSVLALKPLPNLKYDCVLAFDGQYYRKRLNHLDVVEK